MPAFIPLLYAGGVQLVRQAATKAVVKFGKDVVLKNIHNYTGPAAKRKMYDTFMKTSEKVAGSKPAQALAKNLEKVNPKIRKIAPDNTPAANPMEYSVLKTMTKLLRGRAIKIGGQKIQAIKDGLEQGTITENEANKTLKRLNKRQEKLEKTKEHPFM